MDESQRAATPVKEAEPEQPAGGAEPLETSYDESGWPVWAAPFLESYGRGTPDISRAAKQVGVARSTIYRLRDRDEGFRHALLEAREAALDFLEGHLYALGTSGVPTKKTVTKMDGEGKVLEVTETVENVRYAIAGIFYLKRWRPEYREAFRVEQSGPGGGPIEHEVTHIDDTVKEFRQELERLGSAPEPELPAVPAPETAATE